MNLGTSLRTGILSAAVLILAAGCTTSTADGPTSTSVPSVTVSPSVIDPSTLSPSTSAPPPSPSQSMVEPSASTPGSPDISPQEAADRAAIEAQWARFWQTYVGIVRTPSEQRAASLDSVSVDPTKSRVLKDASDFEAQGLDNYGDVILGVYDIELVGADSAVIQDCQDQSGFGSLFVASGKKRTVGINHNHMQAGLVRGSDGVWRVQTLQYVENEPC